jgi:hypothetical protein
MVEAAKGLRDRWRRAGTSEDFAWACLVTNLIGVPGMGTLMARRLWEGVAQIVLAAAGGVLMTWWIAAFVIAELRTMELPPPGGPGLAMVLWGLGLFIAAWVWAALSSLLVLREVRRAAAPLVPPRKG